MNILLNEIFGKNFKDVICRVLQLSNTILVVIFEHKVGKNVVSVIVDGNGDLPECEAARVDGGKVNPSLFDFFFKLRNRLISNLDRKDVFICSPRTEQKRVIMSVMSFIGVSVIKKYYSVC